MAYRRPRTKGADLRAFESFAADLKPEFLQCRDTMHHRERYHTGWDEKAKCLFRVLRCSVCGSEWEQRCDRNGYIVSTTPRYAPGYLREGQGRAPVGARAILRLEQFERDMSPVSPQATKAKPNGNSKRKRKAA